MERRKNFHLPDPEKTTSGSSKLFTKQKAIKSEQIPTAPQSAKSINGDPTGEGMASFSDDEVVRPYAIEEPADDDPQPASLPRRLLLLDSPDHLEQWQREVHVGRTWDSAEEDKGRSLCAKSSAVAPKRGQKRKPSGAPGTGTYNSALLRAQVKIRDEGPSLSGRTINPKRRRRRSTAVEDLLKCQQPPFTLETLRDMGVPQGSWSDMPVPSSLEPTNEPAVVDEMDID
ncbi:Uncharacterized protein PECH_003173 [Penicillium ucsense]|uniref:Uncharacterized protein n=1 Tax=Penicillium ucsense TaxID=2839758 RepID=A0A8J8W3N2_9EURO|nr:Uncharacterized protein PECM_004886 [Penicillium ucsense]KAF7737683.1 Uncharacterized protein PECH_003173 [Penicillium ucsense]